MVGDPSVNVAVAEVASLDVGSSSTAYGQMVRLAGSAQVNIVAAGTGVTLGVNLGKVDGTIQVNVGKVDDNVSVKFATIAGTAGVNLGKVDGTIQVNVGKIDDVVNVRMNSIAGTVGVNLGKVDGTIQVRIDPGYNVVNAAHTIIIPSSTRGTVNTIGGSAVNTVVSPIAGSNIKVYAFSLTTTAQVQTVARFNDGSGGRNDVAAFWETALQAPAQGIAGSNMAVTPPGYLFACGVNTTLAIWLDNASLIHYAVSYFRESA